MSPSEVAHPSARSHLLEVSQSLQMTLSMWGGALNGSGVRVTMRESLGKTVSGRGRGEGGEMERERQTDRHLMAIWAGMCPRAVCRRHRSGPQPVVPLGAGTIFRNGARRTKSGHWGCALKRPVNTGSFLSHLLPILTGLATGPGAMTDHRLSPSQPFLSRH